MSRTPVRFIAALVLLLTAAGCSATRNVTAPAATSTADAAPPAAAPAPVSYSEAPDDWFHLDEAEQSLRGVSTARTYRTLLSGKAPKDMVVVAVLDSGIDINHEDLDGRIWVNEDEAPGNGVDDDGNGYVDDVHGWNFIGGPDGRNVDQDTYELTREYVRLSELYADTTQAELPEDEQQEYAYYLGVKEAYEAKVQEMTDLLMQTNQMYETVQFADQIISEHLQADAYTREQVAAVNSPRRDVQGAREVLMYLYDNGVTVEDIENQKEYLEGALEYGYNLSFDPRGIVGDDYADPTERYYGNNDVIGPDPAHGTAVAGVIAAERDNNVGIKGIADNVRIMVVRTVPDGDERDKDVANAIRYAVDNGADIINMSFGKAYSPQKTLVDEAVRYAAKHDVLLVHASGNDGENVDVAPNFPEKVLSDGTWAENWLEVSASSWEDDAESVASFSNYGAKEVDVFAPGVAIYSTEPGSSYEASNGTSLAAPIVSGIAALVLSYYPELTAEQLKQVITESAIQYPDLTVTVPGGEALVDFSTLSASGGIANAYTAMQAAAEMAQAQ